MMIIIILMVMIIMIMMVIMTMIHYQGLVAHSLVPWLARCWTSHHGQTVTSKSKNSGRMVMVMILRMIVLMTRDGEPSQATMVLAIKTALN